MTVAGRGARGACVPAAAPVVAGSLGVIWQEGCCGREAGRQRGA